MYLLSYKLNTKVSTKLSLFVTKQNPSKKMTRKKERLI